MIKFTMDKGQPTERTVLWDDNKLMLSETRLLNRRTGDDPVALLNRFPQDPEAIAAVLWLALRREAGDKADELVPKWSEFDVNILALAREDVEDASEEAMPVDPSPEPAEAPASMTS